MMIDTTETFLMAILTAKELFTFQTVIDTREIFLRTKGTA
jgi:hypothetical protein